jgi:hypothetical protein
MQWLQEYNEKRNSDDEGATSVSEEMMEQLIDLFEKEASKRTRNVSSF